MLPDFSGLQQQANAFAVSQTLELKPGAACSQLLSFLHDFCQKLLPSRCKPPYLCAKPSQNAAECSPFVTTSRQNAAPQIAASYSLTQAATPKPNDTTRFYQLWVAQPSWSPILKKKDGWITVVNRLGKKVPLVLGTIKSHYQRGHILGKRFGKLTNYLMIDVDISSPFHPRNGGIQPILDAMESIGLCRYLLIRSSTSGGLHIYFPLAEPVGSWALARAAHAALTAAGVTVAAGICELFPNKKAFNAEHNGHRLPLQDGSFILDDDFSCIGNAKAVFLAQWRTCAAGQDTAHLAEVLTQKPLPILKQISVGALPPIAWTAKGRSNEVMKKLTNYGHEVVGHKTIQALGDWIAAVGPQLPGFEQFASRESKHDLTRRNWAYRWAKSHFKAARYYAAKSSFDYNAVVAAEALERLLVALDKVVVVGEIVISKLWRSLSEISKELFGVGFSWKVFDKHRDLILESVNNSRNVGLSTGREEDKNSSASEPVKQNVAEAAEEPKKPPAELSTARYVTLTQSKDLSASHTPVEPEKAAADTPAELAMGAVVKVQHSGSDVDGIQTRVTGKATDENGRRIYRLEHCVDGLPLMLPGNCLEAIADEKPAKGAEGVIRATAAQLLQVLGKACPFVGPGLWTIKREEVSPLAWRQLLRLVGRERAIDNSLG